MGPKGSNMMFASSYMGESVADAPESIIENAKKIPETETRVSKNIPEVII